MGVRDQLPPCEAAATRQERLVVSEHLVPIGLLEGVALPHGRGLDEHQTAQTAGMCAREFGCQQAAIRMPHQHDLPIRRDPLHHRMQILQVFFDRLRLPVRPGFAQPGARIRDALAFRAQLGDDVRPHARALAEA